MKYWYLAVLCMIFMGFLYYSERRKKMVRALLFKALSSLTFVLIGFLSLSESKDPASAFLLAGLVFGMAGDVLLNLCHLKNDSAFFFLLGGIAFFIGHILYLVYLVPGAAGFTLPAVIAGVTAGSLLLLFLHRKRNADKVLLLESVAYLLTVSTMASFSVFGFLAGDRSTGKLFRMIGGILFLVSDTILFERTIRKEESQSLLGFLVLITYYPAQCLIAMSIASDL
ncbi:MAG: lysoplasmalogenase [Lachnospiraceae bacterium]|nr:lysoplasmalogenase [Lachnospiraceae bacterium]